MYVGVIYGYNATNVFARVMLVGQSRTIPRMTPSKQLILVPLLCSLVTRSMDSQLPSYSIAGLLYIFEQHSQAASPLPEKSHPTAKQQC